MSDLWEERLPYALPALLVLAVFYGIYRYSRNPAFLGFDLMYAGVLLLYGNLLTLGFSVFAMVMLHLQILQEERYLMPSARRIRRIAARCSGIWAENKGAQNFLQKNLDRKPFGYYNKGNRTVTTDEGVK